jgi:hypothetical protein
VIEAREPLEKTMFGVDRLKEVVAGLDGSLPPAECASRVKDAVARFTTAEELQDDLTLLFLRRAAKQ